jgi:hypothetical protein
VAWDCACGARAQTGSFCPYCGRRNLDVPLPPLPAADHWAPAPRRGLTAAGKVLAVVIGALLLAGGAVVERRVPDRVARSERPAPPAAGRVAVEAAVKRGKAFVEEYRGKKFLHDVDVDLLDEAAFVRELVGEEDDDPGEDEDNFNATLRGLGLADPGEDVDDTEEELVTSSVVGFYDDEAERLVVRGGTLTPYSEMVLVHELTHAWQDQHFDLGTLYADLDTQDEALALRALVEGDAVRTETAWRERQPRAVRTEIDKVEEADAGEDGGAGDGEPTKAQLALGALYGFPYQVGEDFVGDLFDHGGNAEVDAAFAEPPVCTAQVLHPDRYRARDLPDDPADPRAEGSVVDRGSLGEAGFVVLLAAGEPDDDALDVAEGWDGDEYVTWLDRGHPCTTVSVVMTDAGERDELHAALRDRGVRGLTKVGRRALTFVSCSA